LKINKKKEIEKSMVSIDSISKSKKGDNVNDLSIKTATSKEKYSRFYKIKSEELSKFKDLSFIQKCGYELYNINKDLKINKDVYEVIRVYADCAQEIEFNKIETIFAEKEA